MTTRRPPARGTYAACYAAYLVVLVMCVLNFAVWQRATLLLAVLVTGAGPAIAVVHGAAVLVCALALFGAALAAEPYLRAGVKRRELVRRFGRVALVLALTLAAGVVALTAVYRTP